MTFRAEQKKSNTGFTLIELMVVVGIMVAIVAFSLPAFQGIGDGTKIRTGLEKLRVTVSLARQHAITKRENVYIVFPGNVGSSYADKSFRSFRVYGERSGYISNWTYLPEGTVFINTSQSTPNNLFLDSQLPFPFPDNNGTSTDLYYIQFRPDGTSTDGGGGREAYIAQGFYDEPSTSVRPTGVTDWYPRRSLQVTGYTGLSRIHTDDG